MSDETNEFVQGLGEGLSDSPSLAKFKNVQELAKGYINTEKLIGAPESRLQLLNDTSTDEDRAAFHKKLGKPDKWEDYKHSYELKEGQEVDQAFYDEARGWMLESDITSASAEKLLNKFFAKSFKDRDDSAIAKSDAEKVSMDALRAEWGDKFDMNMDLVKVQMERFGTPELREEFSKNGLGNSPHLIKAIAAMGAEHSEDIVSGKVGAPAVNARTRAQMELEQMMTDPEKRRVIAGMDELNEGDRITQKALAARRAELLKLIHPE